MCDLAAPESKAEWFPQLFMWALTDCHMFYWQAILNPQFEPQCVSQVLQLFSSKCSVLITKPPCPTPYFKQMCGKVNPWARHEIKNNTEAEQTQTSIMAHYKRAGVFLKHSSAKVMPQDYPVDLLVTCYPIKDGLQNDSKLSSRGKQHLYTNK